MWFGRYETKYSKAPTADLGTFSAKMAEARDDLHLPAENPFIATNFDIKPPPDNPLEFPALLVDTPLMALWHKQDTTFGKPKGIVHVDLSTPHAYTSPTAAVLSGLFTRTHFTPGNNLTKMNDLGLSVHFLGFSSA